MIFDSRTISDWQTRGITDVSCFLIARGCAGEKVQILEGIQHDMDNSESSKYGITFHTRITEKDFFQDIRITKAGTKWIVAGDSINAHCGCGSSFSRKTNNPIQDKVARMKELIRQRKEKAHS